MTVRDFKRRYLLSRCSPILFYLPGKEKDKYELSLRAEDLYGNALAITSVSVYFYYWDDWTVEVDEFGNTVKMYNPYNGRVYDNLSEWQNDYYTAKSSQHNGLSPVICIDDEIDHIIKDQTQFSFPIEWDKITCVPQSLMQKTPKMFINQKEIIPQYISTSGITFSLDSSTDEINIKNLQKGMFRLMVEYEKEDTPDDERYIYYNQVGGIKDPYLEQKEIDYATYYGEGPYSMNYYYDVNPGEFHFTSNGKLSLINSPDVYYKYTKEVDSGGYHYWTDSRKDGFQFYHLKYQFPNNQLIYGWKYSKRLYTTKISYKIWYKNNDIDGYVQFKKTDYWYSSSRFSGANIYYLNNDYPEDEHCSIEGYFAVGKWTYERTPYGRYTNYFNSFMQYYYEYDHADLERIEITKENTNIDTLPNKTLNIYFKAIHYFNTRSTTKPIPSNSINFYQTSQGEQIYCSKVAAVECYIDGEYCGYYCTGSLVGKANAHHNILQLGYFYPYTYEYNYYLNGTYRYRIDYIMPGESGEEGYDNGRNSNGYYYDGHITYDLNKDTLFGIQFDLVDDEGGYHEAPIIKAPFYGQGDGSLFKVGPSESTYAHGEWTQGVYIRTTLSGSSAYLPVWTFFDRNCYNDTMGINYDNHNCQSYYYLGDGLTKDQLKFFMARFVN